jgi:hypothetical protein
MVNLNEDTKFQIRRSFITEQERDALFQWSERQRQGGHLKNNGKSRFYNQTRNLKEIPAEFFAIRDRIVREIEVDGEIVDEPHISSYISTIGSEGKVHLHRDATRRGCNHLRFNLMVSKPEGGGRPIISNTPVDVSERDMWYFFANKHKHTSEMVIGNKRRVICSYGFLVPGETKATLFDFLANYVGLPIRRLFEK